MKTPLIAALTGAFATAVVAAVPLWLQHKSLTGLYSGATASEKPSAMAILRRWNAIHNSSSSPDAELLAAESVQILNATECRLAADLAMASGDKSPLSDLLGRWASVDGKEAFTWLTGHPELIGQVIMDAGPAWAASDHAGYAEWLADYLPARNWGSEYDSYIYCKWLAPYDLRSAIRIMMKKFRQSGSSSATITGQLLIGKLDISPFITSSKDAKGLADEIVKHPEWLTPISAGPGLRPLLNEERPMELLRALRQCWQEVDAAGWDAWAAQYPMLAARADNKPRDPGEVLLLSRNPPSDATQMLREAPPDKQAPVLKRLLAAWSYLDLNAAGTWLRTLPDGPLKWEGVQTFALTAVGEDPAAALQWADSITDPTQQARAQRRVFTSWYDYDPAAATVWLAQSGWNDSQIKAAHDIIAAGKTDGK